MFNPRFHRNVSRFTAVLCAIAIFCSSNLGYAQSDCSCESGDMDNAPAKSCCPTAHVETVSESPVDAGGDLACTHTTPAFCRCSGSSGTQAPPVAVLSSHEITASKFVSSAVSETFANNDLESSRSTVIGQSALRPPTQLHIRLCCLKA